MRVRGRLGAMSGMTLGSTMCCPHLTDRHNLPAEAVPAKANVPRDTSQSKSHSKLQKFLAIFCRADSAHPAEHARKVLLCFEAAGHRDVQDTRLGRSQHLLRTLYPMTQDKVMRALAG